MIPSSAECHNLTDIIIQAKHALLNKNSIALKEVSNRTTHSSCFFQDEGNILTAVLIYSLSKIIERQDYKKIKNWDSVVQKIKMYMDLSVESLKKDNYEQYIDYLKKIRDTLENSLKLKEYVQEVLRKASINKGAKLHEHGLSLGKTSELLGISQWELSEYTGQRGSPDKDYNNSLDEKKRIKMAMEFFE